MMNMHLVFKLSAFLFLCSLALGKECTNSPTQLSSHTFRYELLKSNNETLKEEVFSHYHLTPTDETAWTSLLPRKILKEEGGEFAWTMMYRKMKNPSRFGSNSPSFLKEVSLHDVRLDQDSIYGRAQQTNLEYLLMLDVDRLVWSFRKTAGIDTPGKPYGGWEDPTTELRGHFVGHYLSASAQMWASTHNQSLKTKMSAVVSALSACQKKTGTGYLSAFPSELFDRFEAVKPVWAPYYTIHKIMAGLLDQYKFAGDNEALKMVISMANYFYDRVQNVIKTYTVERHWRSLNEETGGMNDVLYQLFSISGDSKHLLLAHLFDKPCFLGLLAVQADDISGFHANTHIPIVIGSQLRYEITGDPLYKELGTFFMNIVNSSHSYATGGTSVGEFWSDPKRLASDLQTENEESCTTYNMLKVSRNLFRWTKEAAYGDYYERALTNGVLGIQRGTEPGKMIYMLPLGRGVSKAVSYHGWGTQFDSFWCCYGTGIESFSKLGDSIYFEEDGETPGLYVIQYIPSSLDWKSGSVQLNQKVEKVTSWNPYLRVTFTISSKQEASNKSTLNLRVPVWTNSEAAKASVNGQALKIPAPGNFLSIIRSWKAGDQVKLELPLSLRTEAIKDDRPEYSSLQAILYGPYLLAGHTTQSWSIKIRSDSGSPSDWIKPIPESQNNYLITLFQQSGNSTLVLAYSNQSVTLQGPPAPGTDSAIHSTFRLISADESSSSETKGYEDLVGKPVFLEPFDLPGFVISQETDSNNLVVKKLDSSSYRFKLVPGLNKKIGSVSLELESKTGCYVYGGINQDSGTVLKLECKSDTADESFKESVSFMMKRGHSQYHPISFVAKGEERNFVMAPLFSFRDETYNVYYYI